MIVQVSKTRPEISLYSIAPASDGADDVEDMARVHEKRTQKRNRRNFGEMI